MSAVHWIASWIARDWCSLGGRVEDGLGATKWRAKATSSLKRAKWFPVVPFHIYMSHKAAKSMAKRIWFSQSCDQCTSAGQVMPESQSAACREDMAIWRPPMQVFVDVRHAWERGLSESRLFNLQKYVCCRLVHWCS